jgi:hypothetical protein
MSEVWPDPDDFIRGLEQEVGIWPIKYRGTCTCGWRGQARWDSGQAESDADKHDSHGVS